MLNNNDNQFFYDYYLFYKDDIINNMNIFIQYMNFIK